MRTRSNGLGAPAYSSVAQFRPGLDDRSAQALLAQLERAGIAAYLQADDGDDDLYVDVRQLEQAREMLPQRSPAGAETPRAAGTEATADSDGDRDPGSPGVGGPGSGPAAGVDEDVWAALVEAYNSADAGSVGRWPASEDLDPPGSTDDATSEPPRSGRVTREVTGWEPYISSGAESDAAAPAAGGRDPEDHFRPPEPPPLPRLSFYVASGWVAAMGVPVLLVILGLIGIVIPAWGLLLAGGAFVYGLTVLFAQMRSTPLDADGEPIGDDDNGAAV
jgi:hypothetical protein